MRETGERISPHCNLTVAELTPWGLTPDISFHLAKDRLIFAPVFCHFLTAEHLFLSKSPSLCQHRDDIPLKGTRPFPVPLRPFPSALGDRADVSSLKLQLSRVITCHGQERTIIFNKKIRKCPKSLRHQRNPSIFSTCAPPVRPRHEQKTTRFVSPHYYMQNVGPKL